MREIAALVFPGFELLDLYGPLELFGMPEGAFRPVIVAAGADPVASAQGPRTAVDRTLADGTRYDILLVPGGEGTRQAVRDENILDWLRAAAPRAEIVASVCTGAVLLGRAGLLDGRRATTNKRAFGWVAAEAPGVAAPVLWQRRARWVEDGRFVTASGVSAGMDMALAVIARLLGPEAAADAAAEAEYRPAGGPDDDPFALPALPDEE